MPSKKPIKDKVDKRYRAKVTVGHDADGEPVYRYASGKTKKELEANKKELQRHYIDGLEEIKRDTLFDIYMWEWYRAYKEPAIGDSSRRNYDSVINKHIVPQFAGRQIRAIRAMELQTFLSGKAGMGETTLTYIHTVLTNVFRRAYAEGIIDRDPTASLKKPPHKTETKRALTDAETRAALRVGSTHRDGLLLLILYYTGLRKGEALALTWNDIDFKERVIHVWRDVDYITNSLGDVKSRYSIRDVPMPTGLYDALDAVRGIGEAFLLPSPKSSSFWPTSTYTDKWDGLMRAMCEAESEIDQKDGKSVLTAHYFRHNYASVLYNAGVDVLTAQKYLGHADPKTTLDIYSHLDKAKEKKSANKLLKAFDKKVAEKLPAGGARHLRKK